LTCVHVDGHVERDPPLALVLVLVYMYVSSHSVFEAGYDGFSPEAASVGLSKAKVQGDVKEPSSVFDAVYVFV
jgi:hypothetical protein